MDIAILQGKIKQEEADLAALIEEANRQIAYKKGKVDALKQLLAESEPAGDPKLAEVGVG